MGERLTGSQEVDSSILFGSTEFFSLLPSQRVTVMSIVPTAKKAGRWTSWTANLGGAFAPGAALNLQHPLDAVWMTALVLVGPTLVYSRLRSPRT